MRDSEEQRMCIAYIHTFEGWIQVPDNNKGGKRGRFTRLFVWVANLHVPRHPVYPSTHVALSVQKPCIPGCDPQAFVQIDHVATAYKIAHGQNS